MVKALSGLVAQAPVSAAQAGRAPLLMLQEQQTYPGVFSLCDKVLVMMGATAVAPVGHCQKLPLCLTKQMPDGSSKDPLLA